jgi:hypothetical protein
MLTTFFSCNLYGMNQHDHDEYEASEALLDYAISLVNRYTDHPDDVEAATKALLIVTLEHLFHRRIYIEQITR